MIVRSRRVTDRPQGNFTILNAGGTADVIIDFMGSYGPLTSNTCNVDWLRSSRPLSGGVREPDVSVETPGAGLRVC
jgi:hypothetical protein